MKTATKRMAPGGHIAFEDGHIPTAAEKLQPLEAQCPFCHRRISYVSLTDNHDVRIPVNPGNQPDGELVVVPSSAIRGRGIRPFTVRLALPGDAHSSLRRRVHWATCTSTSGWQDRKRAAGVMRLANPEAATRSEGKRSGPCTQCFRLHAWRYGGPHASPICDRCKLDHCQRRHVGRQPRPGAVCVDCSSSGRKLLGEPW